MEDEVATIALDVFRTDAKRGPSATLCVVRDQSVLLRLRRGQAQEGACIYVENVRFWRAVCLVLLDTRLTRRPASLVPAIVEPSPPALTASSIAFRDLCCSGLPAFLFLFHARLAFAGIVLVYTRPGVIRSAAAADDTAVGRYGIMV